MWKNSWDFIGCFLHGSSDGTFKYFNPEKLLPHFMQLNGFSPVWFLSWIVTWCGKAPETSMVSFPHGPSDDTLSMYLDPEKLLPHFMQLNGFSPVWFLSWIVTWCGKAPETSMVSFPHGPSDDTLSMYLDPEKLLPHFMQLNGFSQVWFPSCYLCCTYKKLQYYDMAV